MKTLIDHSGTQESGLGERYLPVRPGLTAFAGMIPPPVIAASEPRALSHVWTRPVIHREDRRFVVNQPARLHLRGVIDSFWEGHISNISRRGMQVVVNRPIGNTGC